MDHPRQHVINLVHICQQKGMDRIVLSPGSRNAPLIKAFVRHPQIKCYSVVDERSAGYMGLGLALATGKPVGLACTSGTAVLNYGPSIAEAYYQGIPLVVITADRPEEWIDQGDGQAMQQQNVFANYVKKSYHLPAESRTKDQRWQVNKLVSEALDKAVLNKPGPVHINVPLHEPLYNEDLETNIEQSWFKAIQPDTTLSPLSETLTRQWQNSKRKMILVGYQPPDHELQKSLLQISEDPSVIVVAENLSNLHGEKFIASVERLFFALEKHALLPDHIICLGGDILSKQAKKMLRDHPPVHNWNVATYYNPKDTFQSLQTIITTNPADFIRQLAATASENGSYQQEVLQLDKKLEQLQRQFLQHTDFSDLVAFHEVLSQLPIPSNLHLGNSSPVRYAQLFPMAENITYFSNRGVSGIDGPVSTALGVSLESQQINVLIIGELSFLYDSNALWYKEFPDNFKIIVINNGGGDIFRIIDTQHQLQEMESYFTTPQHVSIELLVQACGLKYILATSLKELNSALTKLFDLKENITVLEINTTSHNNSEIIQQLYHSFKTYKT